MVLYWTGREFERLIDKPETMLVCLGFLVAPDLIKKMMTMRIKR